MTCELCGHTGRDVIVQPGDRFGERIQACDDAWQCAKRKVQHDNQQ